MNQKTGEPAALQCWRGAEPLALARLLPGTAGEHLGIVLHLLGCEHALLLFPQVLLRVKESEIQYLKQEISSLKDELQTALRVMPGPFLQILLWAVLCSSVFVLRFQLTYTWI